MRSEAVISEVLGHARAGVTAGYVFPEAEGATVYRFEDRRLVDP